MRIQLVALDLDGTLLNSSKEITAATAAVLREACKMGARIVLATARPPRSVMPFYRMLNLDTPMINYNGALVYDPGQNRILMHRPLPTDVAQGLVSLARQTNPQVLVSAEILDQWFTDWWDPTGRPYDLDKLDRDYDTETSKLFNPDVVAPISHWLNQPVTKLLLMGPQSKMHEMGLLLSRNFLHQIVIMQTEERILQIAHATVSKAQALRVVAAELGVAREQVMAIGDNTNDIDMLEWAGIGVAMENSPPEVMAAADVVTGHNDADGVAKIIHKLIIKGVKR